MNIPHKKTYSNTLSAICCMNEPTQTNNNLIPEIVINRNGDKQTRNKYGFHAFMEYSCHFPYLEQITKSHCVWSAPKHVVGKYYLHASFVQKSKTNMHSVKFAIA